ncbi:YybH family protein [Shewanella surugensis]|uniref:Nuclear transport factor 2 family protein n=1 Tax=Shewanella surugensis TaxID=212020 RepID=A0ABT0L8T1_9GAMM|nr:nuclear transport factor 2 family protein [Shewanella surugensis]MCL1124040.1 nuclear transport factor 2 family protein [Shewanella surugensis]
MAQAVPTDDILAVLQKQEVAWNKGDMSAYMQGYWQDEKLRFVSDGDFKFGWQEMLAAYQDNYSDKSALGVLSFTVDEVKMLSNEAAVVTGYWSLVRMKDNPKGVFTLLMEKKSDVWVITQDYSSNGKS